ncbi:MAG: hypothetical protein WBP64_05475 [Nitrososphaeraceae archaeon]
MGVDTKLELDRTRFGWVSESMYSYRVENAKMKDLREGLRKW